MLPDAANAKHECQSAHFSRGTIYDFERDRFMRYHRSLSDTGRLANVRNGWKTATLDYPRSGCKTWRVMKGDQAFGTPRQRAIVAVLAVIFVFCTVPYYLGFRPFGEATRLLKVASFVMLLSALYLFGAFRGSSNEPR